MKIRIAVKIFVVLVVNINKNKVQTSVAPISTCIRDEGTTGNVDRQNQKGSIKDVVSNIRQEH